MTAVDSQIIGIIHEELSSLVARISILMGNADSEDANGQCVQLLKEVAGTCTMLEATGARQLTREILEVCEDLDGATLKEKSDSLSGMLALIPSYVETRPDARLNNACLVLPEISRLRAWRGKSPLYECQLLRRYKWPSDGRLTSAEPLSPGVEPELKRLRHLYQVGLLDVLKNRNREKALALLARVAARLQQVFTTANEAAYWKLVERVLLALGAGELSFTAERTRLLSAVEKQLKMLAQPDDRGGRSPYPLGLWQAMSGLLALTSVKGEDDRRLRTRLGIPQLDFTDGDLRAQRQLLIGERQEGLVTALGELKERLTRLHALLALLDDGRPFSTEDKSRFRTLARELTEICTRLGLTTAAEEFSRHRRFVSAMEQAVDWTSTSLPGDLAQSVLYLECLLIAQGDAAPTDNRLRELNDKPIQQVVEENLITSARNGVYRECLRLLATAKEFIDEIAAGYAGRELVPELAAIFTTLRGTAIVVGETRVVDIAWRCADFATERLLQGDPSIPRTRLVTNFADAVVSLEYHFELCSNGEPGSNRALEIADEYLAVLGA